VAENPRKSIMQNSIQIKQNFLSSNLRRGFATSILVHKTRPAISNPRKLTTGQSEMAANVLDAAIMHNAFQSLFTSLTAEQVNIFTEQIHAVPSPTAQPTNAAGTVEMESVYSPKDKASTGGSSGLQKAIRAKERQAQLQVKAKKRATNNFITFRGK
jgi:hypothetical protein